MLALVPSPAEGDDAAGPPLSVLVISPDRRFRSVATVLIARRGCAVATTGHAGRLAELAERSGPDVVVIDLDEGSPAGADAASQAYSLPGGVGVILVDEEESVRGSSAGPPRVHCKWGPFESLFAAIEAAERDRTGRGRDDDIA
jgi:hypothetical protein